MLTEAEKRELEALKAKADLTETEKARLAELEKKAGDGGDDKTYSEDYVKQLRQEAAKYRTRAKEADEKLASYDGVDPDEYKKLKEAAAKAEEQKLRSEGEFDKLRQKLVEDQQKALAEEAKKTEAAQKTIKQLEAELSRVILSHEITAAAAMEQAINPKLVEMVIMNGMAQVEKTEDGRRMVKVLESDGKTARIDAKTGKPVTILQLLKEMKLTEEYAHLFAGGKPGAGSGGIVFDGKTIDNPWKRETLNLTMQAQILRNQPQLAERLKAEAGVK